MDLESMLPPTSTTPGAQPPYAASAAFAPWPAVMLVVVTETRADGKPGKAGTLTFYPEAGTWKVRLSERNRGYDLWATGVTPEDALDALERALLNPPAPWRKAQYLGGGRVPRSGT